MFRQNVYPPASYNNQPQEIPLQYRHGYSSNNGNSQLSPHHNNSNLQSPANAYHSVGRSHNNHQFDAQQNQVRNYQPNAPYRQNSASSSSSNVRSPAYLNAAQLSSSASSTTYRDRAMPKRFSMASNGTGTEEKYNLSPTSSHHLRENDFASREPDDDLHNPAEVITGKDRKCVLFSKRGCLNGGALALILFGILGLFAAYPVYTAIKNAQTSKSTSTTPNGGKLKAKAAIPVNFIDPDTPSWAKSKRSSDGKDYKLVFSDEFNKDGRTFRPGDDPFWEAVDLHYWATNDLEWYSPDAITTKNGSLQITMTKEKTHNLDYKSGMLQSWNKFCFQVAVSLPGDGKVPGLWPGIWTLGNLARAGYGATTEGVWPYSYDSCDAGILKNQTDTSGTFSYLSGQRLNKCTCPGEDHPSPGIGRGAPEIDVLEAFVDPNNRAQISQSAQFAPFDAKQQVDKRHVSIYSTGRTVFNSYVGGIWQQAVSSVTIMEKEVFNGKSFEKYAFEYEPGVNGYIDWSIDDKSTWRLNGPAVGPNPHSRISSRSISEEPMAKFSAIDLENLKFPATMHIDYVRIYQDPTKIKTSCSPSDHPTAEYIKK
ncbi:12000_t:CDS:2 [Ambispora leptoticha]|uniref:12000_t:CDS:1 n=1 Tax=Ambispora leptoticha TaxID=144679 RepID=A0A9N8VGY4_9GLOM|nr:12000_t:CDS:2 [Ambispora leptoticha]